MEGLNLSEQLGRVEAPPGFEQRIMAHLAGRKRKRIRARTLTYSLTGAFGTALAVFIAINFFLIPGGPTGLDLSGLEGGLPADFQGRYAAGDRPIPITERMDYAGEVRSLRSDPPTIYILEQISTSTDTKIKY